MNKLRKIISTVAIAGLFAVSGVALASCGNVQHEVKKDGDSIKYHACVNGELQKVAAGYDEAQFTEMVQKLGDQNGEVIRHFTGPDEVKVNSEDQ